MATTSIVTCGMRSLPSNRPSCQKFDPFSSSSSSATHKSPDGCFFPANRRGNKLPYLSSGSRTSQSGNRSKMEFIVYSADQAGEVLLPFGIHFDNFADSWPAWIPGVLMAVVVPFFTNKWGPFSKLKAELDKVEAAVDGVADKVVDMAEKVEEMAGDIADDLPEGSVFRTTLEKVERVADRVGKDAEFVSDMVDKMDELEAKVENMLEKATEKKNAPAPAKVEPQSTNL